MVVLLALVPAAFFMLLLGADPYAGFIGVVFISLPALLPLYLAKTVRQRVIVTLALSAVAVYSVGQVFQGSIGGKLLAWRVILVNPAAAAWMAVFLNAMRVAALRRGLRSDDATFQWQPATVGDRVTAVALDAVALGFVFGVPFGQLRDRSYGAASVGLAALVGALYLAGMALRWQRSLGQSAMDVAVVDARTRGPIDPARAIGRALLVAVAIVGAASLAFPLLAIVELIAAAWFGGRTLTDRLFGTLVVARRPTAPGPDAAVSGG